MHGLDFDAFPGPRAADARDAPSAPPGTHRARSGRTARAPGCIASPIRKGRLPGGHRSCCRRYRTEFPWMRSQQPAMPAGASLSCWPNLPEKGGIHRARCRPRARHPAALGGELFLYPAHTDYFQSRVQPKLDHLRRFPVPWVSGVSGGCSRRRAACWSRALRPKQAPSSPWRRRRRERRSSRPRWRAG